MPTRRPTDMPADPSPRPEVARPAARAKRSPAAPRTGVSPEARRAMIAQSAYLRAERRGFEPGHEEEDWLAAETEVDALLRVEHGGSPQ